MLGCAPIPTYSGLSTRLWRVLPKAHGELPSTRTALRCPPASLPSCFCLLSHFWLSFPACLQIFWLLLRWNSPLGRNSIPLFSFRKDSVCCRMCQDCICLPHVVYLISPRVKLSVHRYNLFPLLTIITNCPFSVGQHVKQWQSNWTAA